MTLKSACMKVRLLLCVLLAAASLSAQQPPAGAPAQQPGVVEGSEQPRAIYLLNPGDQVVIRARYVEEISDLPFRIDNEGFLSLPVVGRVRAAGLTVEQLEALLVDRLKVFIQNPQVVISLIETARQQEVANPVYLVGPFRTAGVYALSKRAESLSEILMKIGGLQPSASRKIRIIRRAEQGPLDLQNVSESSDAKTTYAEVALTATGELANPADDIIMKPFDALIASKIEPIYVTGEVSRGGALPLEDREYLTATQVLSLVGIVPTSDIAKAKVLRAVHDTAQRAEIPLNLDDVMAGRANDFPLMANDILYIPSKRTGAKQFFARLGQIAVPATITSLLWVYLRQR